MNCVDVIEELGTSGEPASAALAEHLARCPDCAAWARRDARLTRLWEATRPEEPSPQVWEALWAELSEHGAAAATPAAAAVLPLGPVPLAAPAWRRWMPAALSFAQAAALLFGALWVASRSGPFPVPVAAPAPPSAEAVAVATVEIPVGDDTLFVIRGEGTQLEVDSVRVDDTLARHDASTDTDTLRLSSGMVDPGFDMLGKIEAMAAF